MKPSIKVLKYLVLGILLINHGVLSDEAGAEDNIVFRDDFVGKSLRPEWEIKAKDSNRMTLVDNEYLLLVTYGPRNSAKNRMIYRGELPENYEITLKIETTPELAFQGTSLGLAADSKNHLVLSYYINNITIANSYFGKNLIGEWSEYKNDNQIPRGKSLFLKIEKKGIEYTGFFSLDGASWTKVGTHVFLNLKGNPEFLAYNTKKKIPESGIRIDYFEIKKID